VVHLERRVDDSGHGGDCPGGEVVPDLAALPCTSGGAVLYSPVDCQRIARMQRSGITTGSFGWSEDGVGDHPRLVRGPATQLDDRPVTVLCALGDPRLAVRCFGPYLCSESVDCFREQHELMGELDDLVVEPRVSLPQGDPDDSRRPSEKLG